jgi:myosin heavy subunit
MASSDNSVESDDALTCIDRKSSSSSSGSKVKRRASRAGTRSVSTLTASQLERKRANDREAQRAIRQRTRDYIDQLEKQVADLTTKGEEVTSVMQRNAALEAEVSRLRCQLQLSGYCLTCTERRRPENGMSDYPYSNLGVSHRLTTSMKRQKRLPLRHLLWLKLQSSSSIIHSRIEFLR